MILITGGSGFIGSHITSQLLEKGYSIRILDNKTFDPKIIHEVISKQRVGSPAIGKVEYAKADILKKDGLKKHSKDIDTVIHLAGIISYSKTREQLFQINVGGTQNLLEACKSAEKFILSSSVSVYPETSEIITEKTPTNPETPYGESKLEAEKLVEASGLKHANLRLAPVYGVGSPIWLKNLRLLEKGFPIPNTKSMTHVLSVENAAQAFTLSVKKGNGVYLIADKGAVPFVDFASKLVTLLGKKPRVAHPILVNIVAMAFRMKKYLDVLTKNRQYDISKAARELGYKPKENFQQELEKMVEWYKHSTLKKGHSP